MFERFTDRARHVFVVAQAEAKGLGHNFLGTEHLLLGLLDGEGVAARVLRAEGFTADAVRADVREMIGGNGSGGAGSGRSGAASVDDAEALASIGIDLDQVRAAVEESFGEGALDRPTARAGGRRRKRVVLPFGGIPIVPRAKKVLELSLREALSLGHSYIGTEHLLLAILREGQGVAATLLAEHVDPAELRAKVIDELRRLRPGA